MTPAKSPGDSNDLDKSNGKSHGTGTKDSAGKMETELLIKKVFPPRDG